MTQQDSAIKHRHWQTHRLQRDNKPKASLRYAVNCHLNTPARRWVIFMNGRSEWIEKYDFLPELLGLSDDTGFLTWDHRGQGQSTGKRGAIDSYATFASDAATIIREIVKQDPYVIICHSMGGLIALNSCLRQQLTPDKMVLCSPLLGLYSELLPTNIVKPVAKAMYYIGFKEFRTGAGRYDRSSFANNKLTHSVEMFNRSRQSPYRFKSASFGWINATLNGIDFVFAEKLLRAFSVPTLVLVGTDERVVAPNAISRWVQRAAQASNADLKLEYIHGAKHELLAEIPSYRDLAIEKLKIWLRGKL